MTVDGETRQLPEPFLVLATQNPVEFEGTFRCPRHNWIDSCCPVSGLSDPRRRTVSPVENRAQHPVNRVKPVAFFESTDGTSVDRLARRLHRPTSTTRSRLT